MFKKIFYFILIVTVAVVAVFFTKNQGDVNIVWLDYQIKTTVPFFIIFVLFVFYVFNLLILKPINFIKRRRHIKSEDFKQTSLVTSILSYALIDDKKTALKLNEKLLSKYGENPLVNLALAKVDDNKTLVEAISNKLIENKETLVLGLKGLIELNEGVDDTKALVYANQAFKETKLPWALKSAVRLMIKNGLYEDALKSLDGNKKLISQEEFKEVKVSLLMKLSENEAKKEKYLNEVIKLDYTFVPAYISLASFYKDKGKDNKALKCLKKAYQTNPDIMIYDYVEKNLCGDGDIIKITKELIEDNLNNDVSTLILARSHMKAGIFGQALNYFKEYLVNNAPNTKIALFMAKLEKEMGNLKEVEKWNNAILNAEFDGKYRCEKCGFEYSSWQASCDNCGSFSSIKWSDLNSKSKEIVAYN